MSDLILNVENLNKTFTVKGRKNKAVRDVNFFVKKGEAVGFIGESGSGKSTVGRLLTGLVTRDSGNIFINGKDYKGASRAGMKEMYRQVQMVFQDARGSFNPRSTIKSSLTESICSLCKENGISAELYAVELLEKVGLNVEFLDKYPHQLSGGQCQRVALARALAAHPTLLICDEVTSALDVFAQAQIMRLLARIQETFGMSIFFISHDLPLVSCFCSRIYVIKEGVIVEEGKTEKIINEPEHPYTKHLLQSILKL